MPPADALHQAQSEAGAVEDKVEKGKYDLLQGYLLPVDVDDC